MKIKFLLQLSVLLFVSMFFITACNEDDPNTPPDNPVTTGLVKSYDAEAALRWNEIFLEIERYAAGYRPGPAPRALALMNFACYEACVSGMPGFQSIKSLYSGLNLPSVEANRTYHWPTVVHAIWTDMIPRFFPNIHADVKPKVDALIGELNAKYSNEISKEVFDLSRNFGTSVAVGMWNWSVTDPIGHDHYKDPFKDYIWQNHYDGPGDWEPTKPGPDKPMGGIYGGTRTFAIYGTQKICRPPSYYNMEYNENKNSNYYAQALETYTLTRKNFETKWIGEFWSDDLVGLTFSPGPRWIAIGNQIIRAEKSNLETAIFAYVKTGMAISDAAVGAWHSKYIYNVERPATYIRKFIDPNYVSALDNPINGDTGFTPPFPAYPSGHSTMGGAGAEALASVFGYDYAMTDNCHKDRTEFYGMPRSFESLYYMADENAWSRVQLGVHWRMDCTEGLRFGIAIGTAVNKLPWKKK